MELYTVASLTICCMVAAGTLLFITMPKSLSRAEISSDDERQDFYFSRLKVPAFVLGGLAALMTLGVAMTYDHFTESGRYSVVGQIKSLYFKHWYDFSFPQKGTYLYAPEPGNYHVTLLVEGSIDRISAQIGFRFDGVERGVKVNFVLTESHKYMVHDAYEIPKLFRCRLKPNCRLSAEDIGQFLPPELCLLEKSTFNSEAGTSGATSQHYAKQLSGKVGDAFVLKDCADPSSTITFKSVSS